MTMEAPTTPDIGWQATYRRALILIDLLLVIVTVAVSLDVRFGSHPPSVHGVSYVALSAGLVLAWVAMVAGARAYEPRYLGSGSEEFKRIGSASLRLFAVVATVSYTLHLELARGYVAIALPGGTVLLLAGRYGARRWLHAGRRAGRYLHRVLAVGSVAAVAHLATELRRAPYAGFEVVGACVPGGVDDPSPDGVPVVGSLTTIATALQHTNADTVAVTHGPGISPAMLRQLSWQLEGSGVDLVVAPALTDVAGPRIKIRPVAGLPLLHVDEPDLSGVRQRAKALVERIVAVVAFVVLALPLGLLMLAIRLDSRGSPVFEQRRVGKHGREFTVYKLRTMHVDAEGRLPDLAAHNEHDPAGPLFKMRADPRVTRVGAVLRKWSLDELPQLWNVVRGDMSIVGPRPPLPSEVAVYGDDVRRRLLVRPGMTGLWQVSGRADLSWDDSVRLDLYYVENWSLAMDAMILWKTFFAVAQRRGAY